jgi:hypothetical protein
LSDPVVFTAALAGSNTNARCLTVSREGDAKLVLEIPASDLGQVLLMLAWGDTSIRITAEPV